MGEDISLRCDLWTGEPGLNVERWRFWKGRLVEVKLEVSVGCQVARDYLEQAKRAMVAAEEGLAS